MVGGELCETRATATVCALGAAPAAVCALTGAAATPHVIAAAATTGPAAASLLAILLVMSAAPRFPQFTVSAPRPLGQEPVS